MNIRANLSLVAAMAEMLAPYRDDEETFLDTLDGETDCLDLLDREIKAMQSDEALADAIRAQISDLTARRDRIDMRAAAHRKNMALVLDAIGISKAERPLATVSKRPGNLSVQITDEVDLPSQLMREKTTYSPDKAAIKSLLEAGENIPGAELVRGADILTVRVK